MSETPPQGQPDDAMIDLLVKQVVEGLSSAEERELDVMDSAAASAYLRDFERAAAAVTLAASGGAGPLPTELAQRIARQAVQHFPSLAPAAALSLDAARAAKSQAATGFEQSAPASKAGSGAYGWLAAAACLLLALFAWMRSPVHTEAPAAAVAPSKVAPSAVPPMPPMPPTPAEARAALMADSNAIRVTLSASKDPAAKGVAGDVVWDPKTQKGFLHFTGLASNDPRVSQYQIWIFDAARDPRYPVDAGVFDVPANAGDVIIPINATLGVSKAAAFAVTVEKPGGVVVSARQHVVALGAAS